MRFGVSGPYRVPTIVRKREIDFDQIAQVYRQARRRAALDEYEFDKAIGLYVLGLSPAGTSKSYPYYVGQACKQYLVKRSFQRCDKLDKYYDIMQNCGYTKAAPIVYFLPLFTASGRLARLGAHQDLIDKAEYTLIGLARSANVDLWNVIHRVGMDALQVDGLVNSVPRAGKSANSIAAMFGLR